MVTPPGLRPAAAEVAPDEAEREEQALRARFEVASTEVQLDDRPLTLLRPANADALISEEDFVRDERLPYWADLWPSAVMLARHLASQEGAGRTLLDLGCGLGLLSAAAAGAGYEVTSSDYYEDALLFARLNVLRHAGRAPATWHLDWRHLPDPMPQFDTIVASDVMYEREYAVLISEILQRALAPGGEAWLSDPGRLAMGSFLIECARRGLDVERHEERRFEEGAQKQLITIFRIVRVE